MPVTYNWTIPTCEHDIATGGINVVHWRCTASETALASKIDAQKNPTEASGTPWAAE